MKDSLRPLLLIAALIVLSVLACGKASPVAPSGTTLSISANPSTIGLNGTSTITVIGRQPNGNPLNPGTEIIFSADRGSIDPIAKIQSNGVATATFRADGRSGTVHISAVTGGSAGGGTSGSGGGTSASIDLQVGLSSGDKPTLIVSVSPNNIPVNGSAVVTIIARNADGSAAAAGQTIILTTNLGSLSPDRPVTKSDGTATSKLNAGAQAGTATISAILGSSEAATSTLVIRDAATDISLQAKPGSVTAAGGTVTLSAFVTNAEGLALQGAPVTFTTDHGTLDDSQGVVVFTDTTGIATKTLTLSQQDLVGVSAVHVTAKTPNGAGQQLPATVSISVSH
ncbi:MAG TPA: invasin domain 3-containing protein [Thermoanaerobaculia bacterium]|jgi:hypothetical protein|nr:invasin domain 3-containing protein [Thermoanaerobaculia bacterium]